MSKLDEILEAQRAAEPFDMERTLADIAAEESEHLGYQGPPLSPGAIKYLGIFDGHREAVEGEARYIADCYGSRSCERLHMVMAAQKLGLYRRKGK